MTRAKRHRDSITIAETVDIDVYLDDLDLEDCGYVKVEDLKGGQEALADLRRALREERYADAQEAADVAYRKLVSQGETPPMDPTEARFHAWSKAGRPVPFWEWTEQKS